MDGSRSFMKSAPQIECTCTVGDDVESDYPQISLLSSIGLAAFTGCILALWS